MYKSTVKCKRPKDIINELFERYQVLKEMYMKK